LICRRELASMDDQESVWLEGDIGGGLVLARNFVVPKDHQNTVKISSSIQARTVGAGSGGFSRLIQLRVFPMFKIVHPLESLIKYTAIDGTQHEVRAGMEFYETSLTGSARPNGECYIAGLLIQLLIYFLKFTFSISLGNSLMLRIH
jgi:hypothetical protein